MARDTVILGISCFYHDSAAVLLKNGEVIAAAQEERFSRVKNDDSFPTEAIRYCLKTASVSAPDIDYVVFYEKPFLKFERIIDMYIRTWPRGLLSFIRASIMWAKTKLFVRHLISKNLAYTGEILFVEHHMSHAAAAYYTSPFTESTIVSMDGVGESATTTIARARGGHIEITHSIDFPHSLGLLYSAVTAHLGFKVNSGEFEVMGLAAYGDPSIYRDAFKRLVNLNDDGSFSLAMQNFAYEYSSSMTTKRFHSLFGDPRKRDAPITQREKDIAAALQEFLEHAVIRIARHARSLHDSENLCLSGGVALNCKANGTLSRQEIFDRIYVPAVPGDAGGALGAALYVHHAALGNPKTDAPLSHVYVGPEYSDAEVLEAAHEFNTDLQFSQVERKSIADMAAKLISEGKIVGWFQGRMEYGPRALGNRSILADPRALEMKDRINSAVKFRDSFRPFAPAVLEEDAEKYFEITQPSPYMSFIGAVKSSELPAVTHTDGTARIQIVRREDNAMFYDLIARFRDRTGCPVVLNTSFNVKDEPIVMMPRDAIRCFLSSGLDYALIGNIVFEKRVS